MSVRNLQYFFLQMGVSTANCKNIHQETDYYDFRLKTTCVDIVHFKNVRYKKRPINQKTTESILFGKK